MLGAELTRGGIVTEEPIDEAPKVIWEDPPPEALAYVPRAGSLGDFLSELRERPGEWARIPREYKSRETASAAASAIRRGVLKGVAKGEFAALAYETRVWARLKPPKETKVKKDQGE